MKKYIKKITKGWAMYRALTTSLIASFLLIGCSLKPDLEIPKETLPESFETTDANSVQEVNKGWWKIFNDPTLNTLIEESLKNNDDILSAAAKVSASRAYLRLQDANQYPSLDASANGSRDQRSLETYPQSPGLRTFNTYSLNAVLSYEIDLWGKLSSAKEAALSSLLADEATKDAVTLSVIADTANGYFALIALNEQVKISQNNLDSWSDTFAMYEKMYRIGEVSDLTLAQTKAQLEGAKADLETIRLQRDMQNSALKIILGRDSSDIISGKLVTDNSSLANFNADTLPSMIPSKLLTRRPDIKAAEESLKAANASIGAARALYFPSIGLTGIFGGESEELKNLFTGNAQVWSLGGNIAAPLFQFGRIGAQVDSAKAQKESAIIEYQKTVRNAFAEVVDSINSIRSSKIKKDALTSQSSALANALNISQKQFDAGYIDYLTLLDNKRSLYASNIGQTSAKLDNINALITAYKVLGGGWNYDESEKK